MNEPATGARLLTTRVLVLAAVFSGTLLPLSAAAQSVEDGLADLRTAARVEQALGAHADLRAFDYALRVEDGVLTLIGALPSQALHQEALALAGATRGVREVVDSLAVPDPPATDTTATGTPSIDTTSVVPRDTLVLPKPEPEMSTPDPLPEAPAAAYHTVRRGDTLFRVAQRYGTTVAEIRRLNNLRSTTIAIGQRLRVR
ncbi:MAG: LysM peptidoglycan-binding domain-containing protein [Bacteroidota bacterium]